MTRCGYPEYKYGEDFDEYGNLPDSLDDPRRAYGTHVATFVDWIIVCGSASVAALPWGDPVAETIHDLRAMAFYSYDKPENGPHGNGRSEVETSARTYLDNHGVALTPEAFAAVWSRYVNWIQLSGRFLRGLHEVAHSALIDGDAEAQVSLRRDRWRKESLRQAWLNAEEQVNALRAELKALKAPA